VLYWRLCQGQAGLPTALAQCQLGFGAALVGRINTAELADWQANLAHPALYGQQDWFNFRRWWAQQEIAYPEVLDRLAVAHYGAEYRLLGHYLTGPSAGLDAEQEILPLPYYARFFPW
jgi:hypothetical protein